MQTWQLSSVAPGDKLVLQTAIGEAVVDCFDLTVVGVEEHYLKAKADAHGEEYRIDLLSGSVYLAVAPGVERRSSFQRIRKGK